MPCTVLAPPQTPEVIDIPDSMTAEKSKQAMSLVVPDRPLTPLANQLQAMCVELPPEEENHLRSFIELKDPTDDPYNKINIVTSGKTDIQRGTMIRLTGDTWLSDDIIHAFLNQTAIRGIQQGHRVLCLGPQLAITTDNPRYSWTQLHRRELKHVDITSLETILTPVNVGGDHRVLAHADLTSNTIAVYDSFHRPTNRIAEGLQAYLKSHPQLADRQWTIDPTRQCPVQTNGFDCGLFTCAAALCIINRQDFHFHGDQMRNFRLQLAHRLLSDTTSRSHTTALQQEGVGEGRGGAGDRRRGRGPLAGHLLGDGRTGSQQGCDPTVGAQSKRGKGRTQQQRGFAGTSPVGRREADTRTRGVV